VVMHAVVCDGGDACGAGDVVMCAVVRDGGDVCDGVHGGACGGVCVGSGWHVWWWWCII